jgi:hypothetical protein
MAHAQNARAALRALAPSDIASRRRTTRSRLCGNRGPTYVHANSAASPPARGARRTAPLHVSGFAPSGYGIAAARQVQAPAVRISRGVFPVQRLNACVNALTS